MKVSRTSVSGPIANHGCTCHKTKDINYYQGSRPMANHGCTCHYNLSE